LIDHGASLGFQYAWSNVSEDSTGVPAPGVEPHLLRERVSDLEEWDKIFAARVTREIVESAVAEVPDDFLEEMRAKVQIPRFARDDREEARDDREKARDDGEKARDYSADGEWVRRRRAAYVAFLWKRLKAPRSWVGAPPPDMPRPRRERPAWLRNQAR
jgi:hypothetical protein